jgi:DNA-binding transcriptional MocR family regulator
VVPTPKAGWPFAAALRSANVMVSPLSVALATRWIEDGTADAILRFIRTETAARQLMAGQILSSGSFKTGPLSFNLWVLMPEGLDPLVVHRPHARHRHPLLSYQILSARDTNLSIHISRY